MDQPRPTRQRLLARSFVAVAIVTALNMMAQPVMATNDHGVDSDAASPYQQGHMGVDYMADLGSASSSSSFKMTPSEAVSKASNESLLWGIYRPNLYFGTRPRLPESVMTGLMWFGTQDFSGVDNIRHGCEEGDKFEKYGWLKNDGRSFGTQQLKDTKNNIEITTEFIKLAGGEHGGSWGARISGKPIHEDEPMSVSMMYYVGHEGQGQITSKKDESKATAHLNGQTPDLGRFEVDIEQTKGADAGKKAFRVASLTARPVGVWRVKDLVRDIIIQRAQSLQSSGNQNLAPEEFLAMPEMAYGILPDLFVHQVDYKEPFEFEVRFNSLSSPNRVTSESMSAALKKAEDAFDERFEQTFHLKQHGYSDSVVDFAKATMSNLVGGIGYFYGSAIVDVSPTYDEGMNEHLEGPVARRPNPSPQYTFPASLLTAVPSRSFFPRGFYWDEGFHQTLIGKWDNDLSLEIIESWYNRQDSDGWIQREQILGDEARSRVPGEFQVQYPEHANPPTLFAAINGYVDRLKNATKAAEIAVDAHGHSEQTVFGSGDGLDVTKAHLVDRQLANEYLVKLYPKLRKSYRWMRRTMQGGIREYGRLSRSRSEGYRWRGRTVTHTLTSGLDDYPRSPRPHLGELHVDLLSWIGYASRNLQSIAEMIGEEEDAEEYEDHYNAIRANIDDLHWSEEDKAYCDLTVSDDEESIFVCHKGYVSLFPLLLGIVDKNSDKFGHVLDMMHDPELLWSPFGLRSISAQDEFYGQGENYWRGPIWININYLALHSLKTYYLGEGPHQAKAKQVYNELRDNLIENIHKEYLTTGYVWEQYNDKTGAGQRSHPFTGWTSTIVLILEMGKAE
ncbi:Processing alpha glucosidase I [Lunasporangiospora selenospora]|uniref:Mannosyl-oligosaccharide glucosidase n=1 Tax=Lunasporangiospora selenospora TaxID=979761 RepID=A0A9P6G1N7_9FUNG|nr:Processing alpha glucosidase I [Lunasporangiospora selenospora]